MSKVIAAVLATSAIPQRLVGHVSVKDGTVTIEYKKPGMVKTSTEIYVPGDPRLAAYQPGQAGFVVALSADPVAQVYGEVSTKNGRTIVELEGGEKVYINQTAGTFINLSKAEEGSREAKLAARAGKVKGVKIKKDKAEKKSKKSKGGDKAEKKSKKDKGDKKKKKKNKE